MKKKGSLSAEGMILLAIGLIFLLAAAGIFFSVRNYVPAPVDPGTGIPGEKKEYRETAIAFVQENRELLFDVMKEYDRVTGRKKTIDIIQSQSGPVLRMWSGAGEGIIENSFLRSALNDTILEQLSYDEGIWKLSLDYSSGMVSSSLYYDILYSPMDPAQKLSPGDDWVTCGKGRTKRMENKIDFYLEEIGGGFWYSYISWP